jgi:hypothetical protein
MSISRTSGIFGDWGDIRINTYSSGISHAIEPLLNAEQLAGNGHEFGQYYWWVVSYKSLSSGQCFLFARTGCVHNIDDIPLHAVLLERAEAVVTFCPQRNTAIKFRSVKRANLGRSFAGVECHGSAGRGSDTLLFDDLGHLE